MSNAQAIAEVWEFFDADGKGYVESEGLAEALAARLTAVEPNNLQALMMRLNPTEESRISFAAFSAGLHGWLTEHAQALPSPAASQEAEECAYRDDSDDKENLASPSPLREVVAANQNQELSPPRTSPGKQLLRQVCEQLKAQIAAKQAELDTSKATILSLLEGGGGVVASVDAAPAPPAQSLVASSLGTATSEARVAADDGHHAQILADQAQQLRSRDKIISEMRSRQQGLTEEIEDLTQDNKRLTAQVKADRRLREQHASLLAKSKAAREQAAAQAARAAALEEELAQLSAKVKHEQSKNSFSKEQRRVWQDKLAAKEAMLTRLGATLTALHEQHTALTQSVVESAASARAMTAAAAARAASLQDAHASVERLTEQMNGMEARCAQLASQLASEKDARQAAQTAAEEAQRQLLELQSAAGLRDVKARASQADYWRSKFEASLAQAARQRNAAALKVQRVSHEYAQLQKQLLAANQEVALSASLVHQLTVDAGGAPPRAPSSLPEQGSSEPARGDGAAPSAGWLALSRSWDQGRLAVQAHSEPERQQRADALAAEVASIRQRISKLRNSYAGDEVSETII